MVSDLLDLSKLEANHMKLSPIKFTLTKLLHDVFVVARVKVS